MLLGLCFYKNKNTKMCVFILDICKKTRCWLLWYLRKTFSWLLGLYWLRYDRSMCLHAIIYVLFMKAEIAGFQFTAKNKVIFLPDFSTEKMSLYWLAQKWPQIFTIILRFCIGKVAWFAVYICGNFWVTQYLPRTKYALNFS